MYVTKRSGKQQPVSFDKITERIAELASGSAINVGPLSEKVQPVLIAQKVCAGAPSNRRASQPLPPGELRRLRPGAVPAVCRCVLGRHDSGAG